MIIADENIDSRIITALQKAKFKVVSIAKDYQGFSDEDVIEVVNVSTSLDN